MTERKTMKNNKLVEQYAPLLEELFPLARRAYGSRNTASPQHDASREYTRLLVEYYNLGGSLIDISKALGVTYAGVRRRVTTVDIAPTKKRVRSKATPEEVASASFRILEIKNNGSVEEYHEALRHEYEDNGISLNKIAKALGLSSSNPLYYGVARTKMK